MQEILLIDGENFQASELILEEIIKNHSARIKNLYADFSEEAIIKFWSNKIYKFGLEQKQTLKIQGKGSVDANLMLDALEYSIKNNINRVIICGNDKDYIPLCKKLRDYNVETYVYGNGYSNIVHFCDKFTNVYEKKNNNKIYDIEFNSESENSIKSVQYKNSPDYFTDLESDNESEEDDFTKIRNYLLEYFNKNTIKRIRVKNLKKAIRKNKEIYQIIKKKLSFSKLDKSLIKYFPSDFKITKKKGGTTCFISLRLK
jgi:uncharacterized LabA/DUF88 family protein